MPAEAETPNDQPEIVAADKPLRVRAILAVVLLVVVGGAAIGLLNGHLREIEQQAGENLQAARQKALRLTAIAAAVGGLGFVGMGGWFWWLGRRVHRSGRFPPPGMKVIKNTPVRTGARARTVAHLAQVAGLLCVIAGTFGMWYLYQLAVTVSR